MKDCFLNSGNKSLCTGCGACMNICPKNAISMIEDEEGFKYPYIDRDKCINCKLCEQTCPITKELPNVNPKACSYITNDDTNLIESSSGGAFSDIVENFFETENTYVYGCIIDDNLKVIHIGVNSINDIVKFKKSKYVQSDLQNVFIEIKQKLLNENKVIFSGTPCQVAGLKSFLKKEYSNLLCIDIVCHGVPSQKIFDYYLNNMQKKYSSKITKVNFREKVLLNNGSYDSKNIKIVLDNNDVIIQNAKESSYLKGFQKRLFYRPSCYKCKFANVNRYSDITICDAWGIDKINNKIDLHKGASYVIGNTEKGKKIVEQMKGSKKEIPIKFIVKYNECYAGVTPMHKKRKAFFKELNQNNFEKKVAKYANYISIRLIKNKIKVYLGYVKRFIINILKNDSR